ncbi:MAG: HIT family protein [Desulfuromonas sp.]|uniref:HIT domain-containing protein n=1 Tax=Desulfuromonas sp. TaxID=892 RepID=UPI000CC601D3|nr:HIT domain-containing protein [Desulfuromonas sp.]PLX84217.1 MAG: HIT family protein [Desulfuromonas sp.]
MFTLDSRLQNDTIPLGRFDLSLLLLMNDASYPWCILVPRRKEIREIYQLAPDDQRQLLWESSHLSERLATAFGADKMNVAALGNVVPQLHLHHVVRYRSDPAWPAPVWGRAPAVFYTPEGLREVRGKLAGLLENFREQTD